MTRLVVRLLGPPEVELAGKPVTDFASNKVRALLFYLILERDRPHRRESLAGLLWPDYPERSARTNLSNALSNLRTAIDDRRASPPFFHIERQTIQWNSTSDCDVDAAALTDLADQERWGEAAALYGGPFLEGFSLADSAPFEQWTLATRERLQRQAMTALGHLITRHEGRGERSEAIDAARRQLEIEPWREEAHRSLIRLLALEGRRSAALAQYETCRRTLREELGVEPGPETQRLYEQIQRGEGIHTAVFRSPGEAADLPPFFEPGAADHRGAPIFVAREHELAWLEAHLEAALRGEGRVTFIAGGAGEGKTALIDAFARRAQAHYADLVVARGTCNAGVGPGDPYLPFRQALEALTGDVEARWAAGRVTTDAAQRLWAMASYAAGALAAVGPDLIGAFVDGRALLARASAAARGAGDADGLKVLARLVESRAARDGGGRRERPDLHDQYLRVLRRVAQRAPIVLCLDDLHWADRGSLNLLFYLGRQIADSPILIVCAYRPEELALASGPHSPLDVVHEMQRLYGDIVLALDHLDPERGRRFIEAYVDSIPNCLSTSFRQALYARTGGHPLYTIELLHMLEQQGDLVLDEDACWAAGPWLVWDDLPARVEAVIAARMARLDEGLYDILSVASVQGERFDAEVIARVEGLPEREVLRALAQDLERRHRLVREQGARQIGDRFLSPYRFAHNLFRHYVYGALSAGERRLLHREVGRALETLYGTAAEEKPAELAFHYAEAGVPEKAVHYLIRAGHQARARYASHEAIRHYDRALSFLPEGDARRFEIWRARAQTYDLLADRAAQRADIEAMLALAASTGDAARRCDARLAQVDYYLAVEPARAVAPARQALEIAQDVGDIVREAQALRRLSKHDTVNWLLPRTDDLLETRQRLERAAALFREAGLPGEAAACMRELANRLRVTRQWEAERDAATEALTLAQEAGDVRQQAQALSELSFIHQRLEEEDRALAIAKEGLALVRQTGDLRQEAGALQMLAWTYMNQHRPAQALSVAQQALALRQEIEDRHGEGQEWIAVGAAHVRLGQIEQGVACYRRSLALAHDIASDHGITAAIEALQNDYYGPQGRFEAWFAFIDEQVARARADQRDTLTQALLEKKARVMIDVGRFEAALSIFQSLMIDVEEREGAGGVFWGYLLVRSGWCETELGRHAGARQHLERALQAFEQSGALVPIARASMSLAHLALVEGDRAEMRDALSLAQRAVEFYRQNRESRRTAEPLVICTRLHLALGEIEAALRTSNEMMVCLEDDLPPFHPEAYLYTHALALRALGREAEADAHLQRAYERVMEVAQRMADPALRQRWLKKVRANCEIVADAQARGLVQD